MDNIYGFKSNTKKALLTRCICIDICPNFDDLVGLVRGKKLFEYKEYKVDKVVNISKEDMEFIINYLANKHIPNEYLLRTVGDFYRIFAVLKKHDTEVYDYIIDSRCSLATTPQ